MTKTFSNWTEYDEWLVENYNDYNILVITETETGLLVEYENK